MHEIKMPQLGQSVEEAAIVEWLKQEGERVTQGEPLFSVQTDKAEIECESTANGTLRKILLEPDRFVPVMTVIALVGEPDEALPDLTRYQTPLTQHEEVAEEQQPGTQSIASTAPSAVASIPLPEGPRAVSPRARSAAKALNVEPVFAAGTGAGGRVMEADVLAYSRKLQAVRISPTARRIAKSNRLDITAITGSGPRGKIMKSDILEAASRPRPSAPPGLKGKRVPLTPMRRIIAERMAQSFFNAPHYYITVEVDMSAAKALRERVEGFRPSHNDIIMRATALTLHKFPGVNARWLGDAIEYLEDVNLGFAVALPAGLVVPVVRRAQEKSLEQIHHECRELVNKARNGKLTPNDYGDNTFTISNLGAFGVDFFTAIINPPDSAILAIGQIKESPVAIKGAIDIRPMVRLTLSSDHRVIDGALAAQFLGRLKKTLEQGEV